MPTVELHAGVKYDIPDRAELRDTVARELDAARVRARAEAGNIKRMELTIPVSAPGTSLFVSQTSLMGTPDEGYVWSLKLASATLSAAGTFAAFKASQNTDVRRLLGVTTGIAVGTPIFAALYWSSDQAELKHGEGLYLLSSVNISSVYIVGEQVTAEKAGKIYD